ncbi:MAG: hypothetical protein IPH34_13220 [Chitinophagaceae bacterium]|nr:hypothetical protein [Chitinophagaceae bacterium]HRC03193.1 hypothetical protein [Niabella sp.]MBP6476956.1 hypothetical protein [Chitinophagaceae bacterium]MBP7109580.1 hypothetical protein [Chitinophagaceae bacterium]HQV55320.1 hypothetical protein [Chitinophagaceae bacterium]
MALKKMALAATLVMLLATNTYSQNCTIVCPENIIVTADPGKEGTTVKLPSLALAADCGNYTYAPASGSFFRLGTHSIIMTTASGQKCSFSVIVTDNEPPVLSPLTLSRRSLWPASNKMKKTKVRFSTSDNGGLVTTAIAVNSNATDGIKDWEMIETTGELRLRSSRLPDGSPRIYTITVTATDESGNKTKRSTSIAVSETMVAKKAP